MTAFFTVNLFIGLGVALVMLDLRSTRPRGRTLVLVAADS